MWIQTLIPWFHWSKEKYISLVPGEEPLNWVHTVSVPSWSWGCSDLLVLVQCLITFIHTNLTEMLKRCMWTKAQTKVMFLYCGIWTELRHLIIFITYYAIVCMSDTKDSLKAMHTEVIVNEMIPYFPQHRFDQFNNIINSQIKIADIIK